jgi:signal transduction histidine kinase
MLSLGESPLKQEPVAAAHEPRSLKDGEAPQPAPESRWHSLLREAAHCSVGTNRRRGLLLCVCLLALIGWLDYLTTAEYSLQDFYWIPVALATWCLGARTGYGFALASVCVAAGTDLADGLVRTKYLYLLWNACSQLISLGILVWILAKLKQLYLQAARTNRLEIELRASQRAFEELRDFGYVIGHNWHAPLRSIDGYSQALLEEYADQIGSPGKDYLQRLRRSSHQMAELTNALLDLIKYSGGKLELAPLDLSALVESIASQLNAAHPDLKVALTCEPGVRVVGDGPLLRAALERLMDNAWKFTRQQAQPQVTFGVRRQPEGPVYFLRDNGVGFSMAHARMLFVPYQSVHGSGEFPGVGIGLPIADRIIRRHGGRIWAEGTEGQGATFYFTLGAEPPI